MVKHTFVADRFTMDTVFIDELTDMIRALVKLVKQAFVDERFTTEAVFIETFMKEAFVDT